MTVNLTCEETLCKSGALHSKIIAKLANWLRITVEHKMRVLRIYGKKTEATSVSSNIAQAFVNAQANYVKRSPLNKHTVSFQVTANKENIN